mgnify:FL=1
MTTNLTTNNKRTRHEYTKDEITPVLAFRKEGYTYTKISSITKIPISTVRWLVKKHAKDSCAKLKAPNRRGKDKGLSRRDVSALTRNLLRDRRQSLDQLAQYGNGVQPLAKSTVLRVLKRIGYARLPAINKPMLMKRHRSARLKWARAHRNWTVEDWSRVIWSGESGCHLGSYSTKDTLWRLPHEHLDPFVLHGTHVQNRSYVGYWAFVSKDGVGTIYVLPHGTTMKSANYQDIIENYLLPHYESGYIFQQDNARYHTTSCVSKFLSDHNVTVMEWPSQSPDLNPIENIWHILNLAIDKRIPNVHSYERLGEVVCEEWEKIDKKVVINCIESMPKRCAEVIKNHGGSTKY